jgi:hypothetical protein
MHVVQPRCKTHPGELAYHAHSYLHWHLHGDTLRGGDSKWGDGVAEERKQKVYSTISCTEGVGCRSPKKVGRNRKHQKGPPVKPQL